MCDSRGSSYPPRSPQPFYFWMWMTAVFCLSQALTLSAFLVLLPAKWLPWSPSSSESPGAATVITRFWTGACLAASLELSLSCSPAPASHTQPAELQGSGSQWALESRPLWLSLQFKDLRDHLNCPHGTLQSLYPDAQGRVVCASGPPDVGGRAGWETWHPSG